MVGNAKGSNRLCKAGGRPWSVWSDGFGGTDSSVVKRWPLLEARELCGQELYDRSCKRDRWRVACRRLNDQQTRYICTCAEAVYKDKTRDIISCPSVNSILNDSIPKNIQCLRHTLAGTQATRNRGPRYHATSS
jgi:hypothetical protein